eukprot:gnl/TRDRNA2_/TRDRNA2_175812_c2_seq16.p1 gnl/TRDRNA2_/TRDRNA2_175812_c2~~gnl/TRDRNA2_/TRDRNA2_175812_c2_seq16.p1  ORF type:complete len:711 (+),score=252.91 gnl/TRDRNA2_/TRDRNA2_175812_c2_seq16:71-2203(+)
MKRALFAVLAVVFLAWAPAPVSAQTPMGKVVALLTELKAKVESDGKSEQQSYDKFACWCERTLGNKAKDIEDAKTGLEEMQKLIMELKGEVGTHTAEIAQLKKDVAKNKQDQKDATSLRSKEHEEYDAEKIEKERCVGALESAIKVLEGAGTKSFLEVSHQAELLSVVGGVRNVLDSEVLPASITSSDLDTVKSFVQQPEQFMGIQTGDQSSSQEQANPAGDYAPASGQIQGILKGMYDAFASDIEKANVEEADSVKHYEELMATKKQEEDTLTTTLEKQTADEMQKKELLAKTKSSLDSTDEQLRADEIFFKDTKASCKAKAQDWAADTRLRTMEVKSMEKALEILTSPEAQRSFASATTTFVQLKSEKASHKSRMKTGRAMKVMRLGSLAMKTDSMALTKVALALKAGGHFDAVIGQCDKMIEKLREEEQADIAHKDRCENAIAANEQQITDFKHTIKKTDESIGRMSDKTEELQKKIEVQEGLIKEAIKEMKELLDMRNEEHEKFVKALEDDMTAKNIIGQAIDALTAFYKKNKLPLGLVQDSEDEDGPDYSVDKNAAPDMGGGGGGGSSSASGGIISIMAGLVEDLEKEIKQGKAEDAEAQKEYEADRGDVEKMKATFESTKIKCEKNLADEEMNIEDGKTFKAQTNEDLDAQLELQNTLATDCDWLKTEFQDRKDKRKAEIDGLMEAKNVLAGQEPDDQLEEDDE